MPRERASSNNSIRHSVAVMDHPLSRMMTPFFGCQPRSRRHSI
jgi:hypothetical protein